MMKTLGYYNGEIAELDEMRIPMNDRASYFGDGVYEATLAANGVIFTLEEHIDRLFKSASLIEMAVPKTKAELAELLLALSKKVESLFQVVYWQVTRGTAVRTHEFPETATPNLWVTIRPSALHDLSKRVKLITVEDTRFLQCNIKTLNLLPNVMASEKAKRAGATEAVFHRGERVTECAHSNLHILKDGILRTAPTDNLILAGITRAHLLTHSRKLGITVEERAFTLSEMMSADEVLITSSTKFCYAADHVDGIPVGGKAPELVRRIQDSLMAEFREATGVA